MKIVTAYEMRRIEAACESNGISADTLMENAGAAIARSIAHELKGLSGKKIALLVGPGNNGGDGLVVARIISNMGGIVSAFLVAKRISTDTKRTLAYKSGVIIKDSYNREDLHELRYALQEADLIIDAVLGTGRSRPLQKHISDIFDMAKSAHAPIYAIDLPTGMDADTGEFDKNGLPADITFMLGLPKVGPLVNVSNVLAIGKVVVLDIGIPDHLHRTSKTEYLTEDITASLMPKRHPNAHKGEGGRLFIIAGSTKYIGAALLAAGAAIRSGVGLVHLAVPESIYPMTAGRVPEVICHSLPEKSTGEINPDESAQIVLSETENFQALLIGPGLGTAPSTYQFIHRLLINEVESPSVVLDADCLNVLASTPRWHERVKRKAILTPHPGEMARLLKVNAHDIQRNRLEAVRSATKFGRVVILKGARTLIAEPSGKVRVAPWINPGLAKGGSGDVLAGLTAGLLAQIPQRIFDVASLAVYLHGAAGNIAVRRNSLFTMTPSDIISALPAAFQAFENNREICPYRVDDQTQ